MTLKILPKRALREFASTESFFQLDDDIALDKSTSHDLDIVIDRLEIGADNKTRLTESLMAALELGDGVCHFI